jgi:hypothetical protein
MREAEAANVPQKTHGAVLLLAALAWIWMLVAAWRFPAIDATMVSFGCVQACVWVVTTGLWPSLLRRPSRKWWLSIPCAGLLAIPLQFSGLPLVLQLALCDDLLTRHVTEFPKGTADLHSQWVGSLWVEKTVEHDGGVYLFTGSIFLDGTGLAYLPPGTKAAPRIRLQQNISGSWYTFVWHF